MREGREVWQRIANEVAADCFDDDGKVDDAKVRAWMAFLGDAKNFKEEPYCLIPHGELMRSQMHRICECILNDNSTNAKKWLDNYVNSNITIGPYGQNILKTMSRGRKPPLKPGVAVLASPFTPLRQTSLAMCTIYSRLNEEIRNHPERLIKMYEQMLSAPQFTFPSGYAIQQQPIVNGFIIADLKNGGRGREKVFRDIISGDPAKVARQIARWQREGIEYDPTDQFKLKMPAHNMNDILFAHFFQASYFGNRKIDSEGACSTMLVYAGHRKHDEIFSKKIKVDGSNFLPGITELQRQAEAQKRLGYCYIHVGTEATTGATVGGHNHSRHAENINIDALLALNPNTMEIDRAYAIGDRNWGGRNMSRDIPRLAVRKVMPRRWFGVSLIISLMLRLIGRKTDDTPTFEFGTLRYDPGIFRDGSLFERIVMKKIEIYATDVKEQDAKYWAQYAP
ncbi:MAG: hypothetical protein LBF49_01810 [Puniceicoccales bacterium]|nr:hypothetical protein [Puniceicoccales bacterium]